MSPIHAYSGGKPFDATLPCVVFVHGALHDHSVFTLLARSYAHAGFGGQRGQLLGANLGRSTAESTVGGQQRRRNCEAGHGNNPILRPG